MQAGQIAEIASLLKVYRAMRCQLLILDAHDFHKFAAAYPNLMEYPHATAQARLAGQDHGPHSR